MSIQLRGLNDRITESQIHHPLPLFLQNPSVFSKKIGDLIQLAFELEKIPYRAESTLNILDFDDTIYSRYEQLQQNRFQDNRGEEGNRLLREEIGFENFIQEFYTRSKAVQRILWVAEGKSEKHFPLVLTAWIQKLQEMKVKAVGIWPDKVPLKVVSWSSEKPREMIYYIIQDLKFIPWKIIVYEDRPECFFDEIEALRQLLPRTEIVIDTVSLNSPGRLRQITSIQQNIYLASK